MTDTLTRMKNFIAAIGAPGSPFAGWVVSMETADVWLSVTIKLIGCVGGIASIVWMFRLNRLEKLHRANVLCGECLQGHPPQGGCPIPDKYRPKACPYNL